MFLFKHDTQEEDFNLYDINKTFIVKHQKKKMIIIKKVREVLSHLLRFVHSLCALESLTFLCSIMGPIIKLSCLQLLLIDIKMWHHSHVISQFGTEKEHYVKLLINLKINRSYLYLMYIKPFILSFFPLY